MATYGNNKRKVSEAEAEQVTKRNEQVWDAFWAIPADKRTSSDWERLLDIEIMVKA